MKARPKEKVPVPALVTSSTTVDRSNVEVYLVVDDGHASTVQQSEHALEPQQGVHEGNRFLVHKVGSWLLQGRGDGTSESSK